MRLAALVEFSDDVCARYRLRAFEPILRDAGHTLDFHEFAQSLWGRLTLGRSFDYVDLVILQRKLLSRPEIALLRRRVKRLWFDIDDAVWLRDSFSPKGFESSKRRGRFESTVQAADGVITGNSYLSANSLQCGAKAAVIIPTCVDVKKYPVAQHSRIGTDLVWVGSASTLQGLALLTGVLETVGIEVPGVRLKLLCDRFLQLSHMPVIETPWAEATEAAEIASADIGISWVPDDPWSRGKCGLKLLQYMAAGLPVVTNPVGVHIEMIQHGVNGFLVETPDEWLNAIRSLAADPELRRRLGANGRQLVEEKYSVEAGGELWLKLLAEMASVSA